MIVLKRDGREKEFDLNKIKIAIEKAMKMTEEGIDEELSLKIAESISKLEKKIIDVEDIQDLIEKKLMSSSRKDVAKEFILFRDKRNMARGKKNQEVYMSIINAVPNDVTRENANMNADTPAGMMMKFASETSKPFTIERLLSEEVKECVKNNYIHIHDADYYPTKSLTCLQHPLDKILKNGFRAGHGSSRPAKRIETASIISCISLETIQNEMHGGQSIPAFDFYLAPYVKLTYKEEIENIEKFLELDLSHLKDIEIEDYLIKDVKGLKDDDKFKQQAINKTVNRVHQSMEAFIHNMNTIHSRGKVSASLI